MACDEAPYRAAGLGALAGVAAGRAAQEAKSTAYREAEKAAVGGGTPGRAGP